MINIDTYCINLEKRPLRWDMFSSQPIPFKVNRFNAIDDDSASKGCVLSHLRVMEKCKDEILIFEDDFMVLGDWEKAYLSYNELPPYWDVLYLGANLTQRLERYSDHLFKLKGGWGSHGIIYRREAIDKILSDGVNVILQHKNMDTYLVRWIQSEFNCFISYPLMGTQRPGYSDIIKEYRGYDDLIPNYEKYTI